MVMCAGLSSTATVHMQSTCFVLVSLLLHSILSRVLISLLRRAVTSFEILHVYQTYNSAAEVIRVINV